MPKRRATREQVEKRNIAVAAAMDRNEKLPLDKQLSRGQLAKKLNITYDQFGNSLAEIRGTRKKCHRSKAGYSPVDVERKSGEPLCKCSKCGKPIYPSQSWKRDGNGRLCYNCW